jgi:hypothetical protein
MYPHIITLNNITVSHPQKGSHTIPNRDPRYPLILEKLKTSPIDWAGVLEILTPRDYHTGVFARLLGTKEGEITLSDEEILYKGVALSGYAVDRIKEFASQGLPIVHLLRFLNKIQKNPSGRSKEYLYKFLEHGSMPITPEGNFIAYKAVQADFYSITRSYKPLTLLKGRQNAEGRVYNGIGETIEIARGDVDDDPNNGCSYGLHVGALSYAQNFGSNLILVEVDPTNVVMVPHDCGFQKCRCSGYRVVDKYTGPLTNAYETRYSSVADGADEDFEDFDPTDTSFIFSFKDTSNV